MGRCKILTTIVGTICPPGKPHSEKFQKSEVSPHSIRGILDFIEIWSILGGGRKVSKIVFCQCRDSIMECRVTLCKLYRCFHRFAIKIPRAEELIKKLLLGLCIKSLT